MNTSHVSESPMNLNAILHPFRTYRERQATERIIRYLRDAA